MNIWIKNELRKTPVYDVYWHFATERQDVYYNRLLQKNEPWTSDAVISKYKFTNAYRVLDRVSQFLIAKIINPDTENQLSNQDKLFRILLYKIFNKIETWQLLEQKLGEISWKNYSFGRYDEVLTSAYNGGSTIYSAAYIMASGKNVFSYARKHQNHLRLLGFMMKDNATKKITSSSTMEELFNVLKSYPLIGPFLAFQYAIDINYSELTDFSEKDFVVAGPGAIDGIAKCFSDKAKYSNEDVIRVMMDNQQIEFERLGLDFKNLFGRSLQLIDCQNLFCEVGKYARISHPHIKDKSGRIKIKQIYRTTGPISKPSFPTKWSLTNSVQRFLQTHLC